MACLAFPVAMADSSSLYPDNNILFRDSSSTSDPFFLLAEDLDGDGEKELVWTNRERNRIDVFSLKERRFLDHKSVVGPFSVTLGDIDGDSVVDLVVPYDNFSGTENGVHLIKGRGDGTFHDAVSVLPGIADGRRCAIVDIDGDGLNDIVTAFSLGVGIFLNQGGGSFLSQPIMLTNGLGFPPRAIVVKDFDKDGLLDVAICHYANGNVTIFRQSGPTWTGTFTIQALIDTNATFMDLESVDLNEDGFEDLVLTSWGSDAIWIIWNRNGVFSETDTLRFAAPDRAYFGTDVHVADLNNDGRKDLVRSAQRLSGYSDTGQQSCIEVFHNLKNSGPVGSDPVWHRVRQSRDTSICRSIATVDVDKDGFLDFVATGWTRQTDIAERIPEGSVFFVRNLVNRLPQATMSPSTVASGSTPLLRLTVRKPALALDRLAVHGSGELGAWTPLWNFNGSVWSAPGAKVVGEDAWVLTYEFPQPAEAAGKGSYFFKVERDE